jgi:transcriptional regulator with XRE-family HTH domain
LTYSEDPSIFTYVTTTPYAKVVGARIKQARKSMPYENGRRISQESFSRKLGVHWVTVSSWERGHSVPGTANLVHIAEITGKPLSFLTGGGEDEEEAAEQMRIERGLEILDDLRAALVAARDSRKIEA